MGKRKKIVEHAEVVRQFGTRLREVRAARNVTQASLAEKAQVALSHLSKLEKGEAAPGLDLLDRLAKALDVTITDLIPRPASSDDSDDQKEQVRTAFEMVLSRAGGETLEMVRVFLSRLAESSSLGR
jgi:transcriptional regulator with XRE-family HTH domain